MLDEEYGSLPLRPRGLYSGDHLYYDRWTHSIKRLPGHLDALTGYLLPWGTLDEHAKHLARSMGTETSSLSEALEELVRAGVLISKTEFFNSLRNSSSTGRTRITSLVCCTKNRPGSLKKFLSSYMRGVSESGCEPPRFLIFDDSDENETHETNVRVIQEVQGSFPSPRVFLLGKNEKADFILKIPKAIKELPEGLIEFALSGDYGANRNASLLLTAGECILSADDDTEYLFGSPPGQEDRGKWEICSSFEPGLLGLFSERQDMPEALSLKPMDILAEHENYLGKTAGELSTAFGSPETLVLRNCDPKLTELLLRGTKRVVLTSTGLAGDSGLSAPRVALVQRNEAREILFSGKGYRVNRFARNVHTVAQHPILTRAPHFIAVQYGLDNRRLVWRMQGIVCGNSVCT